jgi:hypothetical protein
MSAENKDNKKKSAGTTIAEMKNWEDRLRTEQEAPHNWNAAWGEFFAKGVPIEYGDKIKYLEEEMKKYPKPEISITAGEPLIIIYYIKHAHMQVFWR